MIQQWREQQKSSLKTDEELEWELERKAVSCTALIESKLEELYGPGDGGSSAAKRAELRERENNRIKRVNKRKAWREVEFAKELALVESEEKRLRRDEREKDDADRAREELELREKLEIKPKREEARVLATVDSQALCSMVDRVQEEPRESLFNLPLDVNFLRSEKIFEKKLRPWLEGKIDLFMGGPQSDLVEYILRRVNAASAPDALISELVRYLDDYAEPLVERMWRMLIFELMRNGLAFREDKRTGWGN